MLALPDQLAADLPKVKTDSQATAAWGAPGAAVTLRCGVTPPGPSADCQRVESPSGTVDWIVATDGEGTWRFTTFGREPAVEVVVPPRRDRGPLDRVRRRPDPGREPRRADPRVHLTSGRGSAFSAEVACVSEPGGTV
jgi:hypothetical protein